MSSKYFDILIIFILLLLSNVFAKRKETQLIKLKTSMKEDISPSMLAFDYGKLAIEINVGIVVVYNRKLLLIPNLLINSNKFGIKLTGETLLNLCEDIGEPCCNDGTIIGFTTLTEK